jgi:LysM repeat protein
MFLGLLLVMVFSGPASAATHIVNRGDTLWKIANFYGTSVDRLRAANNLWGDNIYPGQAVYIPVNNAGGNKWVYTVRPGDTLYIIASRYGIPVKELMAYNGLKNSIIYPGQKINMPGQERLPSVSRGTAWGSISALEFDTLARIITAEAGNQSYETMVAVGAVVLNRVESALFPNSIRGVVYQVDEGGKYQFEPVLNGWINRPAYDTAKMAALDALNGWDPTNNALYFWESWVNNTFLNSRPVARELGAFTFTY